MRAQTSLGNQINFAMNAFRKLHLQRYNIQQALLFLKPHEHIHVAVFTLFAPRIRTKNTGKFNIVRLKNGPYIFDYRNRHIIIL